MPLSKDEMKLRVKRLAEVFLTILETPGTYEKLNAQKRQQLETGINKAYGQAEAFLLEYQAVVGAEKKGRTVITQTHADVTVGKADELFAKSIECKSVTTATHSDVSKQLRKALLQVGGNTGSMPRDGDVRVIDLTINSRDNPWPMGGGTYMTGIGVFSVDTYCQKAVNEIIGLIKEPACKDLMSWLVKQDTKPLANVSLLRDKEPFSRPNSSRPLGSGGEKIRCLTIKIRFEPARVVEQSMTGITELLELVLQSYINQTKTIITKVVKTKTMVYTLNQFGSFDAVGKRDFK